MSYTEKTLAEFEQIEVVAKIHWIRFIKADILVFLLFILTIVSPVMGVFTFIITLWLIFKVYIDLWTKEMIVTNKRVVSKEGWFKIVSQELKNKKIESVEIRQSFWGNTLGYGDIYFSGTGTSNVWFKCIANPFQVKKKIETILDL